MYIPACSNRAHRMYLKCQGMQMRAMGSARYVNSDSGINARIRKRVNEQGLQLHKIVTKSKDVFIVHTSKKRYVVKGFYSNEKLNAQKKLIKLLKENGFNNTYDFIEKFRSFTYDGTIFVWLKFLHSGEEKFEFDTNSNRQAGLDLLEKFHGTASHFYKQISVNYFDQLEKWEERFDDFKRNLPSVQRYVDSKILKEWLDWGEFSLNGLRQYEGDLYKEPNTIVHGDVAHHNFFYTRDGTLNLIDFDLIHKAPPLLDYLQYANRIMPFLQNSDELWSYRQLNNYKDNPAFLYALLFPTDIFREWNRIVRERMFKENGYVHSVWKMTVQERKYRMELYNDIKELLPSYDGK